MLNKALTVLTLAIMVAGSASDVLAQGAQRKGPSVAKPGVSSAAAPIRGLRRTLTTPGIGGPAATTRLVTPGGRAAGVARAAMTPGADRRAGPAPAPGGVTIRRPGGLKR